MRGWFHALDWRETIRNVLQAIRNGDLNQATSIIDTYPTLHWSRDRARIAQVGGAHGAPRNDKPGPQLRTWKRWSRRRKPERYPARTGTGR